MEKTLVLLKPDSVQRGIIGEVITRFERAGLKIIGMKMLYPNERHYFKHYEEISGLVARRGKEVYQKNLEIMLSGPVVAMVLEGVDAVELVRKVVGDTEPRAAAPGTIRGDYAHMSYAHSDKHKIGIANIVHASGDKKEAKAEIYHWFNANELYNYQTVHEKYTTGIKNKKTKKKPR